jgi:MscS family membrane protein
LDSLRTYLSSALANPLLTAALLFVGSLAVGWIIKRFLETFGRKIIVMTKSDLDDIIVEIVVDRIKWIAVVAGAYLGSEELIRGTEVTNVLGRQWLGYAQGIIFVCFVCVLSVVLIRIADASVRYAMERQAKRTSSRLNEALLPLTNRLINILIVLIALIVILHHFGQDVSSLVVSLGVGSLAIALAAQETIANMIGGFLIITDRPFRVGDRIRLPSGEAGDVQEIGVRTTKILDFDNNLIISPNADLIKGRIINYSYPTTQIKFTVDVNVAYGADIERVKSIITSLALQHADVLKTPAPGVSLTAFGDSSLNFQLNGRTDDFRKKFAIETALREQIYHAFSDNGIQFARPVRVVQLFGPSNATPQDH